MGHGPRAAPPRVPPKFFPFFYTTKCGRTRLESFSDVGGVIDKACLRGIPPVCLVTFFFPSTFFATPGRVILQAFAGLETAPNGPFSTTPQPDLSRIIWKTQCSQLPYHQAQTAYAHSRFLEEDSFQQSPRRILTRQPTWCPSPLSTANR